MELWMLHFDELNELIFQYLQKIVFWSVCIKQNLKEVHAISDTNSVKSCGLDKSDVEYVIDDYECEGDLIDSESPIYTKVLLTIILRNSSKYIYLSLKLCFLTEFYKAHLFIMEEKFLLLIYFVLVESADGCTLKFLN
ncbi:hypothetical protein BpHYR1_036268 [Brachionus plicatilis]|uniref:Uncharacterized protein n=1 Tax=Brachionus plicatilis TaxID=10195 RepID=A0A3M7PIQ3_BRAPC|nr:hypothetical protein BpHYR1_036268 [Brachionus plicatilis]